MRHLDLFSGIGGFALAARWMGWETVGFCEIEAYCQAVLRKNFPGPGIRIFSDIRQVSADDIAELGEIDIVTGGPPCQPFSSASAGRRKGTADDRYLWPEMLRVIETARPTWVCVENVPHLDGMGLEQVVSDLEGHRYEVGILEVPACAVGLDHRRSRLWILGYSNGDSEPELPVNAEVAGVQNRKSRPVGVGVCDGVSGRVDRLKALGNAIVPQVAYEIFRAIEAAHDCLD